MFGAVDGLALRLDLGVLLGLSTGLWIHRVGYTILTRSDSF